MNGGTLNIHGRERMNDKLQNIMKPRINFITIAVSDLKRSFQFYKDGLGLPTKGLEEGNDDHALFNLENGLSLVLYSRKEFLQFSANPEQAVSSAGFIISHIAGSKDEVNQILNQALKAGAKQIGTAKDEPWGYAANFADPDGHHWEITFMKGYNS
jgi:uncharacterized protein